MRVLIWVGSLILRSCLNPRSRGLRYPKRGRGNQRRSASLQAIAYPLISTFLFAPFRTIDAFLLRCSESSHRSNCGMMRECRTTTNATNLLGEFSRHQLVVPVGRATVTRHNRCRYTSPNTIPKRCRAYRRVRTRSVRNCRREP